MSRLRLAAAFVLPFAVTLGWLLWLREKLGFEQSFGGALTIFVAAGGFLVVEEVLWRIEQRRKGE